MLDDTIDIANKRRVLAYFVLAYLISWLVWMPLVASSQNWIAASPPFILFYLGTIGPALAAAIIIWAYEGRAGIASLFNKLVLWRVGITWYLIALLLPAVIRFGSLGLLYLSGEIGSESHFRPWHELLGVSLLMLVLVPLEEIGWRGYALPKLQAMYGAFWASIILGVLWSLWHLPLVWVAGSYQRSDSPLKYMIVFTVTILPISILFTWLYNRTNGSLLLASLFHAAINVTESALVIRDNNGLQLLLVSSVFSSVLAAIYIVKLKPS